LAQLAINSVGGQRSVQIDTTGAEKKGHCGCS